MKFNGVFITIWAAFVSLLAVDGKDILLEMCPPEVQTTIRRQARDGKIDEVKSLAIEGRRMFIAEVEFPVDKELKIYVLANGALFKTREDIQIEAAPTKVREAAERFVVAGGKVDDLAKVTEASGRESYEFEMKHKGEKEVKILFSAEGTLLSRREKKSKD